MYILCELEALLSEQSHTDFHYPCIIEDIFVLLDLLKDYIFAPCWPVRAAKEDVSDFQDNVLPGGRYEKQSRCPEQIPLLCILRVFA